MLTKMDECITSLPDSDDDGECDEEGDDESYNDDSGHEE